MILILLKDVPDRDIVVDLQVIENAAQHNVPLLPVEDLPALRVTAVALGTLTGEPFYVHLTLDLQTEEQLDRRSEIRKKTL